MEIKIYLDGDRLTSDSRNVAVRIILSILEDFDKIDRYVMYTLRGRGLSNGHYSITLSSDLDDYDRGVSKINIPEGTVLVSDGDSNECFLGEDDYLSILSQVCKLYGYPERAELISSYAVDKKTVNYLLEANRSACRERWHLLIPFLLDESWIIKDDFILSPYGYGYSIEHYDDDLDLIYRESVSEINKIRDVRCVNTWAHDVKNAESLVKAITAFKKLKSE